MSLLDLLRGHTSRIAHQLARMSRVSIRDFADGATGRIVGRARSAGAVVDAPISGHVCVYWHVSVRYWDREAASSSAIAEIRDFGGESFLVEDATGVALVRAIYEVGLVADDRSTRACSTSPASAWCATSARTRGAWDDLNLGREYSEGVIEEGEMVSVFGRGAWVPAADLTLPSEPSGGYRRANMVLVLSDPEDRDMMLSDDPTATKD